MRTPPATTSRASGRSTRVRSSPASRRGRGGEPRPAEKRSAMAEPTRDTRRTKRPAASARTRRQTPAAPRYRHGFSSGVFGLPSAARVVDWVVLNNSTTEQTLRVTLYQTDFNAQKAPVDPPGAMTLTLDPGVTSGRAYSVGAN